ncbi:MAG TPA: efflux RND transporter periplasmic adaptor subunit [Spirochaetota bacterium]|mgnify:CR=1 FL=1|nr:efflux RND transporter periplasmic adaptor subunit [Spirochaetota bacterium]HPI90370.1 efflux RND transporter periplasmic adaptor subunit [Spirochaetota bacterium]HPR47532.1 efflux RND transporter periplasmic adaptor subunit [Spirochaetota bacterium]
MNRKKILPLAAALVIIAGVTLYFEVFRYIGENGNTIDGSGTIEVTEVEIASKLAGRVVSLPRDEGEQVRQGELLVKLAYEELDAQRLSAIANLGNTEKNLKRIRDLFKTGSVSKKDLDNAETAYRVAKANHDYIVATIEQAVIISPISGTVLERNLETGELAFPGTPILTIADLTRPWIKIYVQEKRLGRVKLGQKALVSVDSFPDREFPGKVVSISNRAEFTPKTIQTREERVKLVFAVKIALENKDQSLKPGMPADAVIILEDKK